MKKIIRKKKEDSTIRCLCGKPAVATAYLPIGNVWSGLKEVCEPHKVCEYHAQKAKDGGYSVRSISWD